MKSARCAGVIGAFLGCALPVLARPIVTYTDRPTWAAAVGAPSFTEDFSSFGVDTEFRTVAVAIAGGTIQRAGVDPTEFRNLVDVPPLGFTDNNGTANASTYTNFPEGGGPGCNVRIAFTQPVSAFGFDTWGASSGEGVDVDIVNTCGQVLATMACDNVNGSFRGFRATAGERIGSVFFRSRVLTVGTGGEGFGLDNLAGVNAGPAIIAFADRPTWLAAVGALDFAEDFSSFGVDTEFRTVGVNIANASIQRLGVDPTEFRNLVDVPPLGFTDNNGTNNASCYTNFPEGGGPGCSVQIKFAQPVESFGWETWGASSGEGADVDVLNSCGQVVGTLVSDNLNASFRGFRSTGGPMAAVVFRSRVLTVGTGGEGFGLDNLAGTLVSPPCYPDCNQSGNLTIADFGCFQAAFAAGNMYADCNGSGTLTIADFGCFQAAFAAGCP